MRHKDPELMKRIQAFAEDFYFEEGRSPSTAEIGKAIGIAKGTAHRYLVEMSEKGQIDYPRPSSGHRGSGDLRCRTSKADPFQAAQQKSA